MGSPPPRAPRPNVRRSEPATFDRRHARRHARREQLEATPRRVPLSRSAREGRSEGHAVERVALAAAIVLVVASPACSETPTSSPPVSFDAGCRDCGPACDAGQTACGLMCVDLAADPAHCGSCETSCEPGVPCASGSCVCGPGQRYCSGASGIESCVDIATDVAHCGDCGARCPTGGTCTDGVCACASGRVVCDADGGRGTCVDLSTSVLHCGACGAMCPTTFDCVSGTCACPPDRVLCTAAGAQRCADLSSERSSCGSCGNACATDQICEAGRCVGACSVGDVCTATSDCRDEPAADFPTTPGAFCEPAARETVMLDGHSWDEVRYAGGYCLGNYGPYSAGACDPFVDSTCPACAKCVVLRNDPVHGAVTGCMQRCEVTSAGWSSSRSGCRDGYRCNFGVGTEVCVPACTSDDECRATWIDADHDGERSAGETIYDATSDATCDAVTGSCIGLPFQPDARPGDPCTSSRDCGSLGHCLTTWPGGGYCTRLGCTLDGRGCEPGSICHPLYLHSDGSCLRSCTFADETDPSQILGRGGGDPDCRSPGYHCMPLEGGPAGGCFAGNFNDVTEPNVGEPCTGNADCYSPYGLGACGGVFGVRYCTITQCGPVPFGHSGGTRSTLCPEGTVCVGDPRVYSHCLRTCDPALAGADCPAQHVCHSMGDPRTPVCFPRCRGDGDCGGRDRCLEGICRRP